MAAKMAANIVFFTSGDTNYQLNYFIYVYLMQMSMFQIDITNTINKHVIGCNITS